MSILSTNHRLIKVGQDYSAGSGISIDDHVISVTGGQEITNVVQSNSATWNEISAVNGNYWPLSSSFTAKNAKVDINGLVNNHLVLNGAYPNIKGFVDGQPYWNWEINSTHVSGNKWEYGANEYNKLNTSYEVLSSNSGTWNEVSTTVQTNSAQWAGGDEEVNSFVYNNSATINNVDSVVQSNSAAWENEFDPSYMSGAIDNKLDESAFANVSGSFLTAHQSLDGYATEDWVTAQGYITGVDLSEYAKTNDVLDDINSAVSGKLDTTSFSTVSGDFLVSSSLNGYATESFVETVSSDITALITTGEYVAGNNESGFAITSMSGSISVGENDYLGSQAIGIVKSTSGIWLSPNQLEIYGNGVDEIINANDISALKQLSSDKADVTALTAYQPVGDYATTAEVDTLSSMFSGAIDYVSANAGGGGTTSGFVSGSNVLFVPNGEWDPDNGKVYSATISGDITVSTGDYYNSGEYINFYKTYSLSSVGSQIDDKLNKSVIEDSKTLAIIDGKAEVYSFAYRPSGFFTTGIGITNYSVPNHVNIQFYSTYNPLYSASLVIESDGFDTEHVPEGWNFVNSANGSATFTRFYKGDYQDYFDLYLDGYNLTNASAYPVSRSHELVMDEIAFKSDLTGQGGGVPQSAFDELKASYDALSSLFATYSGQWLLPNEGV